MPLGLKPHSHQDRERAIARLAPLIQQHLGNNLIALATAGSFARGRDGEYSDIEFIGFVKRPLPDGRGDLNFIHNGLLVDGWFMTREDYIRIFKDRVRLGNHPWPYVALNALRPVFNAPFIEEILRLPSSWKPGDFRKSLTNYWPQLQEATGKLLTAVAAGNELAMLFLYWQMVEKMCFVLSLLNERAFTTSATVFSEALAFPILPPSFSSLMLKPDEPRTPSSLAARAHATFQELEDMLHERGFQLYAESLNAFVSPLSRPREIAHRFKIARLARGVALLGKMIGFG